MSEFHCGCCGELLGYTDGMLPYVECVDCRELAEDENE